MTRFMRMLSLGLIVSVFGLAGGAPLGATEPQGEKGNWDNVKQLAEGQEIKVVLNGAKAYRGHFLSVTDEAVRVALPTGPVTFTREEIVRVSSKAGSHRGRNAAIGAAIGFGSGFAMGAGYCSGSSRGDCVAIAGTYLGALLAGGGAGVGALLPSEAWRDVYRAR